MLKESCERALHEKDNNNYPKLLNALFEQPYVTRHDVEKLLQVSNPTAGGILETFCQLEILKDLTPDKSRNKLYVFADYIAILDKGTELAHI